MAIVDSDIGLLWGLKKLFGEETEEEAKAAEEWGAAAKAAEEFAAKAAKTSGESATSKALCEGCPRLYSCLCYPKEELRKEDEERYGPQVLPKPFKLLAIEQRYNKEVLPKMYDESATFRGYVEEFELRSMFNDWAMKHRKRYDTMSEWRLRFKVWCSAKKVIEQRCSNTGEMFSIDQMNSNADQTVIEREKLNGFKPSKVPLIEVSRKILKSMGRGWMKKMEKEFDEWATRHKRVYSIEERDDRCLAYLENMRRIYLWEKHYPGLWEYGSDLDNMDMFPWEADLAPLPACNRCRPPK